jgi:hypothetical protein
MVIDGVKPMESTHSALEDQRWPLLGLARSRELPLSRGLGRGVTRGLVLILLALLGLLLSILAVWMAGLLLSVGPEKPTTRPTTTSTQEPSTTLVPPSEATPLRTFLDLIRDNYPDADELRPFSAGSELSDAARLFLRQPAMVCERGDLWLADPRADDWPAVLERAGSERVHVARELPTYIAWTQRDGAWAAIPLLGRGEVVEALDRTGRSTALGIVVRHLQSGVSTGDWHFGVGDSLASAFAFEPTRIITVSLGTDRADRAGHLVIASRSVIAWSTQRAVRFDSGKWEPIHDARGGEQLLHVLPLSDDTVRLIGNNDADEAVIRSLALDVKSANVELVERLVRDLSAPEGRTRDGAFRELRRLGAGAWPVLERLLDGQPPEARVRMEALLIEKTDPSIGGFRARAGPIRVVQRWRDGSVVLRAPAGWVRVGADGDRAVRGTLLLLRPGEAPAIAPHDIAELIDSGASLDGMRGEIVARTERGLMRRVGASFVPVLPTRLADYSQLRGIDHSGRWLIASTKPGAPSLLLDPTLPDPTPRLPTWSIQVPTGGVIGKTTDGWPVMRSGDAWVLRESGWQITGEADSWRPVGVDPVNPPTRSLDLRDGKTRLVMDEPGILRRVKIVDGVTRELATHSRGIPPGRFPDAMWLDPAGRAVLVFLPDELVIAFPGGRIPREIANLMPARSGDDE